MKRSIAILLVLVTMMNISVVFADAKTSKVFSGKTVVTEKITDKDKEKFEKHKTKYSMYEGKAIITKVKDGIQTVDVAPIGTTRVATTSEFVSGTLYQDQKKSSSTVSTIWNVAMYAAGYYLGPVGDLIIQVANVVYGISSSEIVRTAQGSCITFYSYGYISKLGQVVDTNYSWKTKFETEKRRTYSHQLSSFVARGATKTGSVDLGYEGTSYVNQSHYLSDTYIRDKAYFLWSNNYANVYELFY